MNDASSKLVGFNVKWVMALGLALAMTAAFAGGVDDTLPQTAAGAFVQRKTLADVGVTLTSRGRFRFEKGRFFEWDTHEPVQSIFLATPTNYSISVNGQTSAHALNVDVSSIARIFEIKEMREYVASVQTEPQTGFPQAVKVAFKNGDRLEIELKVENAPRSPESALRPLKFLFMADHHVETDWVESFGAGKGKAVYSCWKPGDHAAITETYRFISSDPYCRDISFALFGGDQINTGYLSHWQDRDAEMVNYYRTLESLELYRKTKGSDVSDMQFVTVPSFICRGNRLKGQAPVTFTCKPLDSRIIAIQGNHDTGVGDFYRECAFTAGDTRFITFFASYVGLPSPREGVYVSTAKISDRAIEFIEGEMKAAAANPSIRHIVLASHWALADKGPDFACPIVGPCRENKMNANRDKLLALCKKYGCDLHISGHEHNWRYPVGRVGGLSNVNCGSLTGSPEAGEGAFAIVEIHPEKAVFNVYSRAAVQEQNGHCKVASMPRRLFTREIKLTPIR